MGREQGLRAVGVRAGVPGAGGGQAAQEALRPGPTARPVVLGWFLSFFFSHLGEELSNKWSKGLWIWEKVCEKRKKK